MSSPMSSPTISIDQQNNTVTITIPLQDLGPSSSGRTRMVVNLNGNNGLKAMLPNGKLGTFTVTGYHKP